MRVRREPKEAGAFTKFKLLMWKNFLQQWRHRVQTFTELFLPVLTMTLVLILRWQIEPVTHDSIAYPPIPAGSLNFSTTMLAGMNISELSIAYSPTSPELEDVLRSAIAHLFVENLEHMLPIMIDTIPEFEGIEWPTDDNTNSTGIFEIIKSHVKIDSYSSSEELRGIYVLEETIREVLAAVEFSDTLYGATTLSYNLSYALRFPERPRLNSFFSIGGRSWRTDQIFPAFTLPGPRQSTSAEGGSDPGYVNEMFIALQQSISTELIARYTGIDEMRNFSVNIQRYPHPSYVEDYAIQALQQIFPMFIMLSFSYVAVNIVRAVTIEKEQQLKESMKIMGLPTWLHWTAWFCKQFIYLLLAAILITIILKVHWFTNEDGFSDYAVFTNTPWTVLFFYLILYMMCTIFFCFMLSGFFSSGSTAALFAGVLWILSYFPAFMLTSDNNLSPAMKGLICLSVNSAMAYGFQLLLGKESIGGMQWGDFMSSPGQDSSEFVFGQVIIMLVVDCVLYMLMALYLEQVMPGPFGMAKPWYFPFQKSFWLPNRKVAHDETVFSTPDIQEEIIKEEDPTGHAVGVQINDLTKVFNNNVAVNHLTLNIYDDQITVLLGHNGAGKSTTMSMLTGNLEPTSGTITVSGYNVRTQGRYARSNLGFCPQHNVIFDELTVREHLEFFARLKGFSGQDLTDEIDTLIEKLELQEKRDYESRGLSGGQKRRLCVGIALCGAARVVLLDEPTSGMDPASRRALWDLLQREKKGRSMILTTHFMDEADILGDRVAIMASGRLQCIGSPYFLKRHYGVGYTLVVVKDHGFDYGACNELIHRYIPGATIKEDRGSEVTYSLKNDQSHNFEEMLNNLEQNSGLINFKNYGLEATTLEDVFLSVGSDVAVVNSKCDESAVISEGSTNDLLSHEFDSTDQLNRDADTVKGFRLLYQHVTAVWLKLWLVWTRSWWLIVLQIVVPLLLINVALLIMEYLISFNRSVQIRPLSLEDGYERTETLLAYDGSITTSIGALAKEAFERIFSTANAENMKLTVINNQPIDQYYLEKGADPIVMGVMRHSVTIGATFEENAATAWFSNFGYHDVATSLATVHSALLKAYNATAELNVFNSPLDATYQEQTDMQLLVTLLSLQVASGIGSSIAIVSAVFVMFYIKERLSSAQLLQKAAGVQPFVLWFSASVFDWLWFMLICITIIISCAIFQVIGLSTATELGYLYLCFMVYGVAMLPLNYLMSLLFSGPAMGFVVLFFVNILFGMMGSLIVEALSTPQLDTENVAIILDTILQFFPAYNLNTAIRMLNQIGLVEYSCMANCDYMFLLVPNLEECTMQTMCEHFSESCCVRDSPYLEWDEPGVLRYLTVMLIAGCVFWSILMIIEYRLPQKVYTFKKAPPPIDHSTQDEDVVDEATHVHMLDRANLSKHGLVAKNLSKYYGKNLAVNQVSFSVNDAECFGLLGVNGAGKTTTFKMLMGDETISSGEAFVSGHSVQRDLTKVHENIGYCPQFDALFGEMTGRETLYMFSLLRGLRPDGTSSRAEALAKSLGFLKHLDKRVDQYSGGTKRKLNTALAFLGRTRLIFVDEPTTGVDPAAKRHVWRAVRGVQLSGRGIVLTSHSMEECEALCSRLTIMVNGRFKCLGTPQHLKNKFSQGFTLTIKLRSQDEISPTSNTGLVDELKTYINANFVAPKIMEEYQGLLTYYLPDRSMPWSKMFGIMERAKRDLNVEDYSISQTTLEQIFLQFTKYQRENL